MKTVLYEEIDGYKIVKGFDRALIDPVATKEILDIAIAKTKEFKEFKTITDKITATLKLKFEIDKKMQTTRDEKERGKLFTEGRLHDTTIESFQDEIKDLLPALNVARETILKTQSIYFEPKTGEKKISAEELEEIKTATGAAMKKGKVLTIDKEEILDNRGAEVYKKISGQWEHIVITKLGEKMPANGKTFEELTDTEQGEIQDHFENMRVSRLSGIAKTREKAQVLKRLPERAALKRSEYEIEKKTDPLKLSQTWLEKETAVIEKRYS